MTCPLTVMVPASRPVGSAPPLLPIVVLRMQLPIDGEVAQRLVVLDLVRGLADPENADAKDWIDQIVTIYGSLGRTPPAEGEEPPPLPFKK